MRDYNGQLIQGDWEPIISAEKGEADGAAVRPSTCSQAWCSGAAATPSCIPGRSAASGVYYPLERLIEQAIFKAAEGDAFKSSGQWKIQGTGLAASVGRQGGSRAVHPEKIVAEWKV
jgi:hypothetical protein